MILYFGSRYFSEVIPEGSKVIDDHEYAILHAFDCRAIGAPKVFFIEVEPDEVRFEENIGYLRNSKKPVGWHRVGR